MDAHLERSNPESCVNRANDYEQVFTLMGRDVAAPNTIRFWAAERIRLGKNQPGHRQITEALKCASQMEEDYASGAFLPVMPSGEPT